MKNPIENLASVSANRPNFEDVIGELRAVEIQLSSLRRRLVDSGGSQIGFKDVTTPGYLAIEVLDGTGVIVDQSGVSPSRQNIQVINSTGQAVLATHFPVIPGSIAIWIPDGEDRGIARSGAAHIELVQYVWVPPPLVPDVLAIGYYERYVLKRAIDGGGENSADASASNKIFLEKRPGGGFQLTT